MLALTPFRNLPRPVQVILLLNLAVFLPAAFFSMIRSPELSAWIDSLVLVPELYSQVWRFVTYAFVHVSPLHFLFNMLMLWMFGEEVAQWIGGRAFWALYLVSAVFAGIFSVPFYASHVIGNSVHILGASGALFGVMVAYGWLFPDRQMLLFLIFPVRARTAVGLFILIDLFMSNSGDGVAHFTHLGGVLAGLAFMAVRQGGFGGQSAARLLWNLRKKQYTVPKSKSAALEGEVGYFDEQKQLDKVLAKITKTGLGSLSPDEVVFLKNASEKQRMRRGN